MKWFRDNYHKVLFYLMLSLMIAMFGLFINADKNPVGLTVHQKKLVCYQACKYSCAHCGDIK